jgi:CDP-glycerol glycerophosphotransferase
MAKADGEYIFFLDSDDYLDTDALGKLVSTAESSDAEVVYGKKTWTWFRRSLFLRNLYNEESESEEDEAEEEGEEDSSDSEQGDTENGSKAESDKSIVEDSNEDLDEGKAAYDNSEDEDTQNLTEEELKEREQEKIKANQDAAYFELVYRRKSLRSITVLNVLMKRSLITRSNISFNEDIIFLSDYPFLLQVLAAASTFERNIDAVYVKRNHNDPVNMPSLGQLRGAKALRNISRPMNMQRPYWIRTTN